MWIGRRSRRSTNTMEESKKWNWKNAMDGECRPKLSERGEMWRSTWWKIVSKEERHEWHTWGGEDLIGVHCRVRKYEIIQEFSRVLIEERMKNIFEALGKSWTKVVGQNVWGVNTLKWKISGGEGKNNCWSLVCVTPLLTLLLGRKCVV